MEEACKCVIGRSEGIGPAGSHLRRKRVVRAGGSGGGGHMNGRRLRMQGSYTP